MLDKYLRDIIAKISNSYGENFFNTITLELHNIIQADYTFIARLDIDNYSSKTISLVAKGELADNIEYSLKDTPCADVVGDCICCYPENVCQVFPNDQLLADMDIEAYLGTPLNNSNGEVMGLIVALYEQPITQTSLTQSLFEIFSGRIAAEIERQEYESALETLNHSLEDQVEQRTSELQETLSTLNNTQKQLIESEKMAALGNLVAGIAHEVNTPLGVAITAQSYMADQYKILCQRMDDESLTLADLQLFRDDMSEALPLLNKNLERAKDLIENFKKVAADQHVEKLETFNLATYYQQVVSTLRPLLKEKSIKSILDIPKITLISDPGVHAQILTNLIKNSVMHGFINTEDNQIYIEAYLIDTTRVQITYSDNGAGFTEEAYDRVFEPFYTTGRNKGGVGLGMSIIYNLITQNLNGDIQILPSESGAIIQYSFPLL